MKCLKHLFLLVFILGSWLCVPVRGQNVSFERERHRAMLKELRDDVKKNYYDPTLKGIDIEARYTAADEKIKQASAIGLMSGIIAQFLLDFEDSHLFFVPPQKANKTDYGFEMRMIGDKCFVIKIDGESDAAKQGLQIGDEIYSIEGFGPTRDNFWKMEYYFHGLRPRPRLKLAIAKPDGKMLEIETNSKITQGRKVLDATGADLNQILRESEDAYFKSVKQYYHDKIPGLFIWKMPRFSLEPSKVDDIIGKAKGMSMILDLRGNSGGRVDMLLRLIGNCFPADLKVFDEKRRKETKEIIARSRKNSAFDGKLVVLIDSRSASASEVFSRVVQLEKRGVIIGDLSAGAVMESMYFGHRSGMDVVAFYGASVTIADLIMKDGKSIERVGVAPDERLIPTGKDLSAGRDVILARAVEFLGFKMTPEEAGKVFPNEYESR